MLTRAKLMFATADLSIFPSGNHRVRFPVDVPGLLDMSRLADLCSFDGHYSLAGTGPFTGKAREISVSIHEPARKGICRVPR